MIYSCRYVALGYIAAIGQRAPSVHVIQCVRADAAKPVSSTPRHPLVLPGCRGRKPVSMWLTDERLATFLATTDGAPARADVLQLALLHQNDESLTAPDDQSEARLLLLRALYWRIHSCVVCWALP